MRSKVPFQPGIGPHSEAQTIDLIVGELSRKKPEAYSGKLHTGVKYPRLPRQKCDLCVGQPGQWEWVIEVKMLRMLGDNGKVNDNMLMHVLSPYPQHRSALTDCEKLLRSEFDARFGILIYGYESEEWPLDPAIAAFERLAQHRVGLGERITANFSGLIHPVHSYGAVYGWTISD
jgi:hypothetical protein